MMAAARLPEGTPHLPVLLDEVIAVGDLRFQAKCTERIRSLRDGVTTVLFASHDLDQVERECSRVLWLQAG